VKKQILKQSFGPLSHLTRSSDYQKNWPVGGISKILNVADFWEGGGGKSGGTAVELLGSVPLFRLERVA
jgi:hypothetical protein